MSVLFNKRSSKYIQAENHSQYLDVLDVGVVELFSEMFIFFKKVDHFSEVTVIM